MTGKIICGNILTIQPNQHFPTIFPSNFGERIVQVCVLYSNFYVNSLVTRRRWWVNPAGDAVACSRGAVCVLQWLCRSRATLRRTTSATCSSVPPATWTGLDASDAHPSRTRDRLERSPAATTCSSTHPCRPLQDTEPC